MRLTFRGWLLSYCQELTELKTTSVKKLAAAVEDNAPHASAAVFLLAVNEEKLDSLLEHVSEPGLREEWSSIASILPENQTDAEAFARSAYKGLPSRYRKVLDAYDAIAEEQENDSRAKTLMAEKTIAALAQAGRSRYRLCRDLGLNEGNVYAWLAGDPSKVSRDTARRAWHYAESL